jgi:hypothetical protein
MAVDAKESHVLKQKRNNIKIDVAVLWSLQ